MESSSANRALPFHIDLNEIPLSSPREADDDDVVLVDPPPRAAVQAQNVEPRLAVVRGSENVTVLCSVCERRRRDGDKDWTCLGCLIRQHSGRGSGGGGNAGDGGCRGGGESSDVGLLGLDINAPPPRELEHEGFVLDLNEDATVGRRYGERNVGKYEFYFFLCAFSLL